MDFLEKIKKRMEERGYNQRSLSIAAGVPYTTVKSMFQRGAGSAGLSTVQKIASVLDISIDYLASDDITDPEHGKVGTKDGKLLFLFHSLTDDEKEKAIAFVQGMIAARQKGDAANVG